MNDYGLDPYEMRMAPTMPLMSDRRTGKQFVSDPRLMQGRLILYVHVFSLHLASQVVALIILLQLILEMINELMGYVFILKRKLLHFLITNSINVNLHTHTPSCLHLH